MILVATFNGVFFRAQSCTEDEIETVKKSMLKDKKGLEFVAMTDEEFEIWITKQ